MGGQGAGRRLAGRHPAPPIGRLLRPGVLRLLLLLLAPPPAAPTVAPPLPAYALDLGPSPHGLPPHPLRRLPPTP